MLFKMQMYYFQIHFITFKGNWSGVAPCGIPVTQLQSFVISELNVQQFLTCFSKMGSGSTRSAIKRCHSCPSPSTLKQVVQCLVLTHQNYCPATCSAEARTEQHVWSWSDQSDRRLRERLLVSPGWQWRKGWCDVF